MLPIMFNGLGDPDYNKSKTDPLQIIIKEGIAVKNNNPGNLRYVGQQGAEEGEGGFARFGSPLEGYEALLRDINIKKSGKSATGLGPNSTLGDFVRVYAPPNENDTEQYIKTLEEITGIPSNESISFIDDHELAKAIARIESQTDIVGSVDPIIDNMSTFDVDSPNQIQTPVNLPAPNLLVADAEIDPVDGKKVNFDLGEALTYGSSTVVNATSGFLKFLNDSGATMSEDIFNLDADVDILDDIIYALDAAEARMLEDINPEDYTISSLEDVYNDPASLARVSVSALPMIGGFIAASLGGAYAAMAAGVLVGIGSVKQSIEDAKFESGEEMDPWAEMGITLGMGTAAGLLERVGAMGVLGRTNIPKAVLSKNIYKSIFGNAWTRIPTKVVSAAVGEGFTEAMQENIEYLSTYQLQDINIDTMKDIGLTAFLTGTVAGGGFTAVNTSLAEYTQRNDPSVLPMFEKDEDGETTVKFLVQKSGHDLEGKTVSEEDIEAQDDLELPRWREEQLKFELQSSGIPLNVQHSILTLSKAMLTYDGTDFEDALAKNPLYIKSLVNKEDGIPVVSNETLKSLYQLDPEALQKNGLLYNLIHSNAKMSEQEASFLLLAQEMDKNGADKSRILNTTGWEKNKRGLWVKRQNNDFVKIREDLNKVKLGKYRITDLIDKDSKLFEYYPELIDVEVDVISEPDAASNARKYVDKDGNVFRSITLNLQSSNAKGSLVHEIQHHIHWDTGILQGYRNTTQHTLAIHGTYKASIDRLFKLVKTLQDQPDSDEAEEQKKAIDNLLNKLAKAAKSEKVTSKGFRTVSHRSKKYFRQKLKNDMLYNIGELKALLANNDWKILEVGIEALENIVIDFAKAEGLVRYTAEEAEQEARLASVIKIQLLTDSVNNPDAITGTFEPEAMNGGLITVVKGDTKNTLHELGHWFLRSMPNGLKQSYMEAFEIEDEFTARQEEDFVKAFLTWVKAGVSSRSIKIGDKILTGTRLAKIETIMESFSIFTTNTVMETKQAIMDGRVDDKHIQEWDNRMAMLSATIKDQQALLGVKGMLMQQHIDSGETKYTPDEIEAIHKEYKNAEELINKSEKELAELQAKLPRQKLILDMMQKFTPIFDGILAKLEVQDVNTLGFKDRMLNALFRGFHVQKAFKDMGMEDTGYWISKFFSQKDFYIKHAALGYRAMTKLAYKAFGKKDYKLMMRKALLSAEDEEYKRTFVLSMEGKSDDTVSDFLSLVDSIQAFFKHYEQLYIYNGGLRQGFKDRVINELSEKAELAKTAKQRDEYLELMAEIENIREKEFIHIPTGAFWFLSKAKDAKDLRIILEKVHRDGSLSIKAAQKRENLTLNDMIEAGIISEEDVDPTLIFQSYGNRLANDMALLNIKNAALREGALIKNMEDNANFAEGYVNPTTRSSVFKGYHVHKMLMSWVDDMTIRNNNNSVMNKFFNMLSHIKMAMFYNPVFLPMYDVLQASMYGSFNLVTAPVQSVKLMGRGLSAVLQRNSDWEAASKNGAFAVPFSPSYDDLSSEFIKAESRNMFDARARIMSESLFGGKDHPAYKGLMLFPRALKEIYSISYDVAWTLDQGIRTMTYLYNNEVLGLSERESGRIAALVHGDYANVPIKTRKMLNGIFFTPTFKIAMGNFLLESIKNVPNTISMNNTTPKAAIGGVVFRTLGILMAYDMFMLYHGWEREKWAIKYKKVVNTDVGHKELVVNWSNPANLFLKFAYRFADAKQAFVANKPQRFLELNQYELHPFYRMAISVVNNNSGGDQIYNTFDDPSVKWGKATSFAIKESIALLKALSQEGSLDETGRKVFADNFGKTLDDITSLFMFKYTRTVEEQRMTGAINRLRSIAQEEIEGGKVRRMIMSLEKEEDVDAYLKKTDEFLENYKKMIDAAIDYYQEEEVNTMTEAFFKEYRKAKGWE